ncbi:hypothetical protein JW979_04920 [bacterium]|nr:hypothetical protein [candidate division CSSED10-310 bacterium]
MKYLSILSVALIFLVILNVTHIAQCQNDERVAYTLKPIAGNDGKESPYKCNITAKGPWVGDLLHVYHGQTKLGDLTRNPSKHNWSGKITFPAGVNVTDCYVKDGAGNKVSIEISKLSVK